MATKNAQPVNKPKAAATKTNVAPAAKSTPARTPAPPPYVQTVDFHAFRTAIENSERDWARYNQQVLERLGLDRVPSAN